MSSAAPTYFDPYAPLPLTRDGMPIFYEDEEEGDMGESNPHSDAGEILHVCLKAHLSQRRGCRVFLNMNCYYLDGPRHPITKSLPYVSPDIMVVRPTHDLGQGVSSYTIGRDGPAPVLAVEVLSARSAQQRDQGEKLTIYARLGIAEYLLVDTTGRFLHERLSLRHLRRNLAWKEKRDADGGITSRLGFRVIVDSDDRVRPLSAATGIRYARPDEAEAEAEARRQAEQRVRHLEAEIEHLRRAGKKRGRGKK